MCCSSVRAHTSLHKAAIGREQFVLSAVSFVSRRMCGRGEWIQLPWKGLPVNHVVWVKIDQSLQSTMGDGSYFHFLEGFLVNWKKRGISSLIFRLKVLTLHHFRPNSNQPSKRSEAEPKQYSITSCRRGTERKREAVKLHAPEHWGHFHPCSRRLKGT